MTHKPLFLKMAKMELRLCVTDPLIYICTIYLLYDDSLNDVIFMVWKRYQTYMLHGICRAYPDRPADSIHTPRYRALQKVNNQWLEEPWKKKRKQFIL